MSDSTTQVVTRFAPSPTGQLHVGGARTALYAWAFARRHGGRFLLRLEDTDRKRSSEAAAEAILADLKWLGLDWDNPEIPRQSQRLELYNRYIDALIKSGDAYEADGAVRFRMGDFRGDIVFDDAVYGRIQTPGKDLEDFVIRKADGFPTFHLAVVVDDADMGVTHVIRGQEHLSNTPKHAALCDALGFKRPTWAHLPSIMNPDGSKMSKRDKAKAARAAAKARIAEIGFDDFFERSFPSASILASDEELRAFIDRKHDDTATAVAIAEALGLQLPEIEVADFRRSGYLPGVLLNYLALLGWNPGNDVERFDKEFVAQHFSFDRVNKANSKFDRAKLLAFNGETIAKLPPEGFFEQWKAHLTAFHPEFVAKFDDAKLRLLAQAYQPRAKTLDDPVTAARFFTLDDGAIEFDPKAVEKVLRKNDNAGLASLREIEPKLAALDDWSPGNIHNLIEAHAKETGKGMGDIAQPLRVAITGTTVSPAIHDTLAILGKDSTLARVRRCLALHA